MKRIIHVSLVLALLPLLVSVAPARPAGRTLMLQCHYEAIVVLPDNYEPSYLRGTPIGRIVVDNCTPGDLASRAAQLEQEVRDRWAAQH